MQKIILALDWTPNINHIGFFIAKEKGYYDSHELEVEVIDPSVDNYNETPAKKVELGKADFALCPTESVISYRTKSNPCSLIAVASILKEDLSAIVVKKDSKIQHPRDLDGKTYASYKARYEDEIVKSMIRNDGGKGDIQLAYPAKLGIWDTLLNNEFDSTWIFTNWEAIQIENFNEKLTAFKMSDYRIPYGYSPVIAANQNLISEKNKAYTAFLKATKKGYLFTQENEDEAVSVLKKYLPVKDQNIELSKALKASVPYFGEENSWGKMEESVITEFLDWIYEHQLETTPVTLSDIMTNEIL